MSLAIGSRLGPYEITASIGAGGMGEVYKAHDSRLNRTVAIKALHAMFATEPERIARFEREAQLLASLNAPNIAAIYGIEQVGAERYLVLEFVDGRSLADVIHDGAMPAAEATALARQIADALVAAHDRGIIHRDLKPGNIMLTGDGVIKVLDFGLGKSLDHEPSSETANSPTMTMAATRMGVILGTAGYMSPEQAKGRAADKRSDVWAFGCVLFELLAGKRAFEGEDITETLAAIVRGEPDWSALPANTPAPLRELVERCLIKNRNERLADMSVVRYLLSDRTTGGSMLASSAISTGASASPRARGFGWPVVAAAVVVTALGTVALMQLGPSAVATSATPIRLSLPLPDGDQLAAVREMPVAISPDGSTVVYAATRGGGTHLFSRLLSETEPKQIAGTDGAKTPFFSPDGQWVGFFAQGKLKKVTVDGGALQSLADAADARGGWWGTNGTIYFAPTNTSRLMSVPVAGGPVTPATTLDQNTGEISHMWPYLTPDGSTLLFTARSGPGNDERRVGAVMLSTGERRDVVQGGNSPRLTTNGYLVYGRLDTLFAVPWSPKQVSLAGAVPVALPEHPRSDNEASSDYAIADNGTLVLLAGGPLRLKNRIVWTDRSGRTAPLPLPEREYDSVSISPDGRQAIVQVIEGTISQWTLDLERGTMTPLFVSGGSRQAPVWTTDSKRIIYRYTKDGFRNIYWRAADGTGVEERLTTKAGVVQTPQSVSPDGKWLVFSEGGAGSAGAPWVVSLEPGGDHTPRRFLPADETGTNGQLSPDGKWLAYSSALSGQNEVYLRPFPGPGARRAVSDIGGDRPRWSRDGRELFFTSIDDKVFSIAVQPGGFSTPRFLFDARIKPASNTNTNYDVARDGRFLFVEPARGQNGVKQLEVVLNWFSQLRPGGK
ncbi:MAG: serine/threonine-protein kinase [Acidobacteria bacterium]|nr:MAG: serine/threonine-protein kinase [Acidobacteriota bacterium]